MRISAEKEIAKYDDLPDDVQGPLTQAPYSVLGMASHSPIGR